MGQKDCTGKNAHFALESLISNPDVFQTQVKKDLALYTRLLADTGVFQSAYAGAEDVNAYVESAALIELKRDNPRIAWISGDGTVLYDNGADVSGLANHLDRPEIREAIETGYGEIVRRSDTFNLNTFYYALLLEDGTILRTSAEVSSITGSTEEKCKRKIAEAEMKIRETYPRFPLSILFWDSAYFSY